MKRRRFVSAALVAAGLAVAASACGGDAQDTVTVFAASSLTNAFSEIADAFEAAHPEIDVELNFAGSPTLREQLADGAEADVFASANPAIIEELIAAGSITGSVDHLVENRLVLAVPRGNPGSVNAVCDLARDELFVGVCAAGVPCGDLARVLLEQVGVEPSIDTNEPNVRSLVNRLVDRELDVALVYASDVTAHAAELEVIDPGVFAVATYAIATVGDDAVAPVSDFVEFVQSADGAEVLTAWGFASS